jgi:CIC family chloride channel protein
MSREFQLGRENGSIRRMEEKDGRLVTLAVLALVVGAAAGLVGAVFRLVLDRADALRDRAITWAHGESLLGFVIVVVAGAAAALVAAWLVRRFSPYASGSGIPHVEAVLRREVPPAPYILLPVKFVGGVLAIGSGMALGREGPSVQMGASIAHFVGSMCRCTWPDCRVLMAAGAGAGLATAFNSPIAGAVFVLEELVRRFEHRIAIAALAASATAIAVARALLGDAPDFAVAPLNPVPPLGQPLFLVLGVAAGLMAVAYNRLLLGSIAVAEHFSRLPAELRAGLIGAAVAAVAWFAPALVGGGDPITQRTLSGDVVLAVVPLAFLLRALLGSVSYAAGTPGGLFAPMLVLGAQLGLLFGAGSGALFPGLGIPPQAFAVVGMAAFFTGVVRAPLTGIVLIIEMTAAFPMLLPMLVACFTAMLVPTLLGDKPIYEALRERTLGGQKKN